MLKQVKTLKNVNVFENNKKCESMLKYEETLK